MKILLRHVFYTGSRSWRFHQFDRNLISSVISQIVIDTGNSDMRLGNRTHERHRNKQSFLEDDPRSWLHQRRSSIDFRPFESSFLNARSTRLLTRVLIPIKDEQQSLASTRHLLLARISRKIQNLSRLFHQLSHRRRTKYKSCYYYSIISNIDSMSPQRSRKKEEKDYSKTLLVKILFFRYKSLSKKSSLTRSPAIAIKILSPTKLHHYTFFLHDR